MDYDKYDNQENQEVRHKRRRSRRRKNSGCAGTMVYIIAVVGASLVISLAAIFMANDVFAFVKDNAMQQFYVTENTKLSDLAKSLDQQGIINYGTVFKGYLTVKGHSSDDVLAGEYQLNPSMDYGQIIDKLTNSSSSDTLQSASARQPCLHRRLARQDTQPVPVQARLPSGRKTGRGRLARGLSVPGYL